MSALTYYHRLLEDEPRITGIRAEIEARVRPGDRVLEIGTGLGTFAIFAARAGARVWAVEGHPVAEVARQVVRANGLDDRIEVIRGWVPEVELPEPVDWIVFEDFKVRLLDAGLWRMMRDAIDRYLAPGGGLIPSRATRWAAPVRSERVRDELLPDRPGGHPDYEIDWSAASGYLRNAPTRVPLGAGEVAADPLQVGAVELLPLPGAEELSFEARWTVGEAGPIHAVALWFDLPYGGSGATNAPEAGGAWKQLLFPVDPILDLEAGSVLEFSLEVGAEPDGAPGYLRWEVRAGEAERRGHEFGAYPAALDDLRGEEGGDQGGRRREGPGRSG